MGTAPLDRNDYVLVPIGDPQPRPAASVGGDRVELVIRTTLGAAAEALREAVGIPVDELSPAGSVRFEGLLISKGSDQVDDELNMVVSVSRAELNRLNASATSKPPSCRCVAIVTPCTQRFHSKREPCLRHRLPKIRRKTAGRSSFHPRK